MTRVVRRTFVIMINLLVLVALVVVVEGAFRWYGAGTGRDASGGRSSTIMFQFYPYLMTGQAKNHHYRVWEDVLHGKYITTDLATNNAGFPDSREFDITRTYAKKPNEKVVLFTGGSTAFGVGATSNRKITPELLERALNAAQNQVQYSVVSLAQGGWIAQQEAIALDVWGRLFKPDWVITLDGVNDATVGCAMSQGTGNPVYYQLINSLVGGYLGIQQHAVFYRGNWENQLIRHSAAYRALTRQTYIPPPPHLDQSFKENLLQVVTPTPLSDIRRQVEFYLRSEESILERFQDAKFILSTQPTSQDFAFLLGEFYRDGDAYAVDTAARQKFADELDNWLQSYKPEERPCSGDPVTVGVSTRYGLAVGAIRLAELVEDFRARQRRDVEYYNTGVLYPKDAKRRADYFIDNYHLNEAGQEALARFYAYRILQRDFPDRDWSAQRTPALWFQ